MLRSNATIQEKYHIKSYKLVDSTNNYCLRFDLYVGKLDETPLTDYGKVHDLVLRICEPYLRRRYHIYG